MAPNPVRELSQAAAAQREERKHDGELRVGKWSSTQSDEERDFLTDREVPQADIFSGREK
jgi:hypothetical protein